MTRKNKIIIFFLSLLAFVLAAKFAFAQDPFGVGETNTLLEGALVAADPRLIITRIINLVLGFLALIVLVLVIYAGFLWMTSGGDEAQISKAKSLLKNALIGLVIILSSWAITVFLLDKFSEAIGGGGGLGGGNNNGSNPGFGAIGACTVESVYPVNNQQNVPRNTAIMMTFKESVQLNSVCVNSSGAACNCDNTANCRKLNPLAIRIYETNLGDACSNGSCPNPNTNITEVNVAFDPNSDHKTFVLTPISVLGSASQDTNYTILLTSDLKKELDGKSMFITCNANYFQWGFTVNTNLDLLPPQVATGSVFPLPDNEKDVYSIITPAVAATAKIVVNSRPNTFSPASLVSVLPNSASVSGLADYHESIANFNVSVPSGAADKAQLFNIDEPSNPVLLGIADFDANGQAIFNNYFIFTAVAHPEGASWNVYINPEQLADTLTVGGLTYTFATVAGNNNIVVPANFTVAGQAFSIRNKLSGHPDINVASIGGAVNLTAKIAGDSGNDITLQTSNSAALSLTQFNGGADRQESNETKDKADRPMNSVIQINFNEAINPLTVSGSASEVFNQLRIVNAAAGAKSAGQNCGTDAECLSYKCSETNQTCVANYLAGKFVLSNGYRTVEFISDNKCGVNGCGEEIYCLPANSHLKVELRAADLEDCANNTECSALSPYNNCGPAAIGYNICRDAPDAAAHNYPVARVNALNGIIDAALNSLDGNRDTFADGPIANNAYNENNPNPANKDNYQWSFYISDQIALDPPTITSISPNINATEVGLTAPVQINFNILMMNSTLRSGSLPVSNGTTTVAHHLINLWSAAPSPLGYWLSADNQDTNLDGEPDLTIATINHSNFSQSLSFNAQVGSGVKDIYQNCYKPSVGPGCTATDANPSCCSGVPTANLSPEGNCP